MKFDVRSSLAFLAPAMIALSAQSATAQELSYPIVDTGQTSCYDDNGFNFASSSLRCLVKARRAG